MKMLINNLFAIILLLISISTNTTAQCTKGGVTGNTFVDLHSISIDPEKNISVGETTRIGFQLNNNRGGTTSEYIPPHNAIITIGFPNNIVTADLSTLTLFGGEYGNFEVVPNSIFPGSFKIWNTTNWPAGTGSILTFNVTGHTVGGSDYNLGLNSNLSISSNCGDINNNQVASGTIYVSEVLSIKLVTFEVTKDGDDALLKWSTESERNNKMFFIDRSTDGQVFERIGEVKGHGTTNTSHSYSFIDDIPYAGVNYYRLRILETTGKEDFSVIESVRFLPETRRNEEKLSIKVFPNPVANMLKITGVDHVLEHSILIFSIEGKLIKNYKYIPEMTIDMTEYKGGVYFIKIVDNQGKIVSSTPIIRS